MGETENPLLRLVQRNTFLPRNLVCAAELLRQGPQIDDDAKIVQQPGKISLARIREINFAGKAPADERAPERMFPEDDGIDAPILRGQHVEYTARHCNVAHAMNSQPDNRSAERISFLTAAEERAICHLQALRGQGFVLRDQIRYLLYIDLFSLLLQITQQRRQDRGNRGNLTHPIETFEQGLLVRSCSCHDHCIATCGWARFTE